MLYAFCLWRGIQEQINNAIAIRLRPNPPLSTGLCNLEIFMDALYAARFFEVMDRGFEYTSFKMHMKAIHETKWYVAPYANYFFGKTMPDPIYAKSEATKYAAYAAALDAALPNSTLKLAPSLAKLASNANQNAISATLYVEAYTAGFRRFFRTVIESVMSKKFGVKMVT
jgi:hypothetical protein